MDVEETGHAEQLLGDEDTVALLLFVVGLGSVVDLVGRKVKGEAATVCVKVSDFRCRVSGFRCQVSFHCKYVVLRISLNWSYI